MKKLFVSCALIIGALIIAPATASAQATGDVDVSITVNGFVILYYYDTVGITIPSNVMAQAFAGADANGAVGSSLSTTATSTGAGALNAAGAALGSGSLTTTQTLTIENAWALRGLIASGSSVAVTVTGFTDLTSASSGDIAVTGGACSGTCTGLTPTLGAADTGDVDLTLDFTGITAPDTFASTATYTITATIS